MEINYSFDELAAIYGPAKAAVMMTQQSQLPQPEPQPTTQKSTKNLTENYKYFPCVKESLPLGLVISMRGVHERGCCD